MHLRLDKTDSGRFLLTLSRNLPFETTKKKKILLFILTNLNIYLVNIKLNNQLTLKHELQYVTGRSVNILLKYLVLNGSGQGTINTS